MINILGFNFYTAEERKAQDAAYAARMFPHGDAQKQRISEILRELCPSADQKNLLFFYLVMKQALLEDAALTLPEILRRARLRGLPDRVTPEAGEALFRLCLLDLNCDERLSYPSAADLLAGTAGPIPQNKEM